METKDPGPITQPKYQVVFKFDNEIPVVTIPMDGAPHFKLELMQTPEQMRNPEGVQPSVEFKDKNGKKFTIAIEPVKP